MKAFRKDPDGNGDEAIEQQAAEWLVEKEEGMSSDRVSEFERWIESDPRHAQSVAFLESSWSRVKSLPDLMALESGCREANAMDSEVSSPIWRRLAPVAFGVAAILVLALGLSFLWPFGSDFTEYTSELDEYKRIDLSDGSVIELNASSRVAVELRAGVRIVHLESGEAHFEVAKDESRPFRVFVGDVAVRAVGTAFNVRYESEEIQVLVTEGRVALESYENNRYESVSIAPSEIVPEISVGELATIAKVGVPRVARISTSEAESLLAWKGSPVAYFEEMSLRAVVERLNAQSTGLRIVIEDEELERQMIGGGLWELDSAVFLRLLVNDSEIEIERPNDRLAIVRRRK